MPDQTVSVKLDFSSGGDGAAQLDRMVESAKKLNDQQDIFKRKVTEGNTLLAERSRIFARSQSQEGGGDRDAAKHV